MTNEQKHPLQLVYIDGKGGNYVWHGFERKGADWNGPGWK